MRFGRKFAPKQSWAYLLRRLGGKNLSIAVAVLSVAAASGHVLAEELTTPLQKDERGVTVGARERPDYDARGFRLGSFVATPTLAMGLIFDSNIFAEENGPISDLIVSLSPALRVASDWGRHSLVFEGQGEFLRYGDHSSENENNFRLQAGGRLDLSLDSSFSARGGAERQHEDRGNPDDDDSAKPTPFFVAGAEGGFFHRFNRLSAQFTGSGRHLNYEDVPSLSGGTVNNDDRDRYEYDTSLRFGYDLNPRVRGFVQGGYNNRVYDSRPDDNGFNRDNQGFDIDGGIALDLTGLIFGEFFAGYFQQFYEDSAFRDVSGFSYGANLTWNITPLITLHFGASQGVQETTLDDASGFVSNAADFSVDYELLRNVIISGDIGGGLNDYNGIDRDDYFFSTGIGGRYLINHYSNVGLDYNFFTRDSNIAGQSYDRHRVGLTLTLQY